jgi:hypothetical protein
MGADVFSREWTRKMRIDLVDFFILICEIRGERS